MLIKHHSTLQQSKEQFLFMVFASKPVYIVASINIFIKNFHTKILILTIITTNEPNSKTAI